MNHRVFFIALAVLCGFGTAGDRVKADPIGMVTGSTTGTYYRFGKDIAMMAAAAGLEILVKDSKGSIDNIKRLNSRENAALGIVQSDVLGFLERSNDPEMQSVARRISLVFPFYDEEVHLFASTSIQRFADLAGRRVVVGEAGSGSWLTAVNLFKLAGVQPAEMLHMEPLKAVTTVLKGEADAMFYVAGKPVPLFTKLGALKENPEFAALFGRVHFVPLEDSSMLSEYKASRIDAGDYPWLDGGAPTLAVKAVLMSFDFSSSNSEYYRRRCQQLARLGQAVRDGLDKLRREGHPKWREVNLGESVGQWQRDRCSQQNAEPTAGKSVEQLLRDQFRD